MAKVFLEHITKHLGRPKLIGRTFFFLPSAVMKPCENRNETMSISVGKCEKLVRKVSVIP